YRWRGHLPAGRSSHGNIIDCIPSVECGQLSGKVLNFLYKILPLDRRVDSGRRPAVYAVNPLDPVAYTGRLNSSRYDLACGCRGEGPRWGRSIRGPVPQHQAVVLKAHA